jgi:hypothetical protein
MDPDLRQWLATLAAELDVADVPLGDETVRRLLDLARDSAHQVTRVSAPLTTFVVGLAVGRGASLEAAAARVTTLLQPEQESGQLP